MRVGTGGTLARFGPAHFYIAEGCRGLRLGPGHKLPCSKADRREVDHLTGSDPGCPAAERAAQSHCTGVRLRKARAEQTASELLPFHRPYPNRLSGPIYEFGTGGGGVLLRTA